MMQFDQESLPQQNETSLAFNQTSCSRKVQTIVDDASVAQKSVTGCLFSLSKHSVQSKGGGVMREEGGGEEGGGQMVYQIP